MKKVKIKKFLVGILAVALGLLNAQVVIGNSLAEPNEEKEWFTNGGFEDGTIEPGSVNWGAITAEVTTDPSHVYEGSYSLKVSGGIGGYQVHVDGLAPNTEYTITLYGKTDGNTAVGVKEYDSTTASVAHILGAEYQEYSLTFTTGIENRSATFYVYNKADGTAYVDNISMLYFKSNEAPSNNPVNEVLVDNEEMLPMSDPDNTREWKLSETLSDEFNGEVLDYDKWYDYHFKWSGRAPSCFDPNNVRVENGRLILTSKYVEERTESMIEAGPEFHTYAASCVMSTNLTGYGYYEICSRTAPITMTSSFWFKDGNKEIDVFEQVGRPKPTSLYDINGGDIPINTHDTSAGTGELDVTTPYTYHTGLDLTADFHVYGFEWGENYLRFYFDGELIHEIPNEVYHTAQYIIFDMETFSWIGYPDKEDFTYIFDEQSPNNQRFTGDFEIEYFRVWRSDVPQSEDPQITTKIPEPKEANAVYGSPVIEANSEVVDELWNQAQSIGDLFFKKDSNTDISADVKTMWDENYLYVLADIDDSDLYLDAENYKSDSFEIYVDSLNEKNKDGYDYNDFKVNTTFTGRLETTAYTPKNLVHNVILKEGGYIVQFKIPWVEVNPVEDTVIGFDVQVNEAATTAQGRIGYLGWNDSMDNVWKSMLTSGNLKLVIAEDLDDFEPIDPETPEDTEPSEDTESSEESHSENENSSENESHTLTTPNTGHSSLVVVFAIFFLISGAYIMYRSKNQSQC